MISIIVPLYNKEKSIERTINSVLHQTYRDFELIIVDDGSTDNSRVIVNSINDDRIRYIYKQNGGVSSARNFGVMQAASDWVFFLDADDLLLESALSSLIECSKLYNKVQVVIGGCIIQEGKKKVKFVPSREKIIKQPLKSWWLYNIFPRTGNLLISKQAFSAIGGFDERLSFNEDYGFLLKLLTTYEIACTRTISMIYTDDNKTLSQRKTPIDIEFGNHMTSLSLENHFVNYFIYRQYLWTFQRRLQMNDKENANRIWMEMKERFSIMDILRNKLMIRISSVYRKLHLFLYNKD